MVVVLEEQDGGRAQAGIGVAGMWSSEVASCSTESARLGV